MSEGAISRQIKLLETYLGIALFVRQNRGVILTKEGQKLYAATDPALMQISQAAEDIRGTAPQITLSVTTSFAIRWLMPRLIQFETAHPDIPVNIQTVTHPQSAIGRSFDASIIYLLGNPENGNNQRPEYGELLMVEWLLPVCSPGFLADVDRIDVAGISNHRIIFNEPTGRDWRSWASKLAGASLNLETALKFEHDDTAIQAATAGHGIALANLAYIQNEIEMGSLVPAVKCDPLPIGAHYLVCEPGRAKLPHINAFREWVKETASRFVAR